MERDDAEFECGMRRTSLSVPVAGVEDRQSKPFARRFRHGFTNFNELIRLSSGANLDEVIDWVKTARPDGMGALLEEVATDRIDLRPQGEGLPLPHPCDAEFRFDEPTVTRLAQLLMETTAPGEEILLVGSPTLAIEFARRETDRRIRFIGMDDCVTTAVCAAYAGNSCFMLGQGSGSTASAAVVDPPWYREPLEEMTASVSHGLISGKSALFVAPKPGTRPGALEDMSGYLEYLAGIGLIDPQILSLEAGYRSPLFEIAALEPAGIRPPATWRYANVLTLRKCEIGQPAPRASKPTTDHEELVFDGMRIRLIAATEPQDLAAVEPIRLGNNPTVFPSVSRRAERRGQYNLWTTTNRVARVDADKLIAAFAEIRDIPEVSLRAILQEPQSDHGRGKKLDFTQEATQWVIEMLATERRQSIRLVGDGAWQTQQTDCRSRMTLSTGCLDRA